MEHHKTSLILNYVLGYFHVYNPLKKRVSKKCMGTHIYIRSFDEKGYLCGLKTILSIMSFPPTVIARHMSYILISIALNLLLLSNTIP